MKNNFSHDPELGELLGDLSEVEDESLPPVRVTSGGVLPDYSSTVRMPDNRHRVAVLEIPLNETDVLPSLIRSESKEPMTADEIRADQSLRRQFSSVIPLGVNDDGEFVDTPLVKHSSPILPTWDERVSNMADVIKSLFKRKPDEKQYITDLFLDVRPTGQMAKMEGLAKAKQFRSEVLQLVF